MKRLWLLTLAVWVCAGCHRGAHPNVACIDRVELVPQPGAIAPTDAVVLSEWCPGRIGLAKPDHGGVTLLVDGKPAPVLIQEFTDALSAPHTVRLTPQQPLPVGAQVVLAALHPTVAANPLAALPETSRSWTVQAQVAAAPPRWSGPLEIDFPRPSIWARLSEPPEHGGKLRLPIAGDLKRLHVRLRLTDPSGAAHELIIPAQRELWIGGSEGGQTFRLQEGAQYTLAAWVGETTGAEIPAPGTLSFEAN